ncbi:hypothetical protein Q5P01_000381 [Channa striata]|uniref:Uncharacterized protein n=1 Tax=Channa striata TaxID=64152 RepID=A0AA88IFI8_CHASR|nr:hypothetical protein Q5P01_000381 [Channa striata]
MTELRNLTVTGSGGAAGDKDEGKTVEVTKDGGDEDEGNKDVNVGLVAGLSVVLLLCVVVLTIIVVKCLRQAAYHLPPEKQSPA